MSARWPQFTLPAGATAVYTADSGIVHASRSVAALQMQARQHGAVLRDRTAVDALIPTEGGVIVRTAAGDVLAGKVVVAADAWTNALLAPLGAEIPLVTMQEQVSYFKPADPAAFERDVFPVWIWEDEHCFYGFPGYGEPTIKAPATSRTTSWRRRSAPSCPHPSCWRSSPASWPARSPRAARCCAR
ncbi:hypothetical protein B0T42_05200 [Rathayibacter sp. VKM Ac-2630]|nr:hypothetical protein B0T42_05200 [Rathayibacter sp. VKM Ac-2630]